MKKILTFLFVLALVPFMQAQWVVESFDNAVGPVFSDPPVLNTNFYTNGSLATPPSYFRLADTTDVMEGTGSMKLDYGISAYESWGGYIVRTSYIPGATDSLPYMDFSTGTHLKLNYKILTPANMTQAGSAYIEFKLAEIDEAGNRDLWYHKIALDLSDVSGTWQEFLMPLEVNSNNELGFALQFGDGDQEIQWHNIKGFEIAIVYITAGGPVNTPVVTGSLLWDKLELVGNRYNPFQTFDNAATGTFSVDDMSWAGTGAGSVALSDNSTDFVEGTGSMQMDYTVNASQSWGGYLNMTDTLFVPDTNFAERTALVFYVKNVNPFVGTTPERVTMRFFLMENSTGANEDWVIEVPINFEQAGDWTRYYLPLKQDTVWTDANGKTRFPQTGFAQTWWNITGDNIFNLESVTGYKIELSAGGTDYGPINETFTGTLLFDVIQQSGFQFADHVAPTAPTNIFVVPGTLTNLVTWEDVPGETNEKYNVYASMSPITDITSLDVDLIASNVLGGTQVVDHTLLSPNTNQSVTYYYAINCKDFAGNLGDPGFSSSVTNTAKGVSVVSELTPAFVADGNLAEWQSLPKFRMFPSDGSGTISPFTTITNDDDCSAEAWVAIDANYLYVAFNVYDDLLYPTGLPDSWKLDSPELFIGLYDWKQAMHTTYLRGTTPDYQIRFLEGRIRNDDYTSECDSMVLEGPDYYYNENFPTGYVVEARIPLVDLATKRDRATAETDVISVGYGDRLPIDFAVNDNDDGTDREGLLFYSSRNNDAGHYNPSVWSYTWLTDWVLDAEDEGALVNKFSLAQNYPNPFNPATLIRYSIAQAGLVTLKVYDVLGREVFSLVNEEKAAGSYDVSFDASRLSSGVYLYKIESGSYQEAKKMILIK
jgi:hypothetical protein